MFTPANVEVVGEGKDGDEELADLEGAVVEQLHRLLSQVAFFAVIRLLENSDLLIFSFSSVERDFTWASLRIENLANVFELAGHIRVDQGDLERRVDGDVLHELPVRQIARELKQICIFFTLSGTFGLVKGLEVFLTIIQDHAHFQKASVNQQYRNYPF